MGTDGVDPDPDMNPIFEKKKPALDLAVKKRRTGSDSDPGKSTWTRICIRPKSSDRINLFQNMDPDP